MTLNPNPCYIKMCIMRGQHCFWIFTCVSDDHIVVYERQSLTCVNLQDKQHNFFLSFLLHTAKQDTEFI